MALLPYDPFRQLSTIRKDFENFITDFPANFGFDRMFPNIKIDVMETENEIVAMCDLPGLEKKTDVNIDIQNNILTISGSINRSMETKQENFHRQERFSGRFQRSVTLPSPVDQENVKATYKNGVLEIRMPKLMNNDRKKIDIEFYH